MFNNLFNLQSIKQALFGTWVGLFSHKILPCVMKTGVEGVNYYGEAHLTRWNAYMHTIGMPFTIYGMVQWIPALLNAPPKQAKKIMEFLYFAYGGHYLHVNPPITLFYYAMYYPCIYYGNKHYEIQYRANKNFITNNNGQNTLSITRRLNSNETNWILLRGLCISTVALIFQEIVGHSWGGDIPSRWEAIPNAILYAKLFSIYHIFY